MAKPNSGGAESTFCLHERNCEIIWQRPWKPWKPGGVNNFTVYATYHNVKHKWSARGKHSVKKDSYFIFLVWSRLEGRRKREAVRQGEMRNEDIVVLWSLV